MKTFDPEVTAPLCLAPFFNSPLINNSLFGDSAVANTFPVV